MDSKGWKNIVIAGIVCIWALWMEMKGFIYFIGNKKDMIVMKKDDAHFARKIG